MAKPLQGVEFVRAADCARRIADAANVAYWIARPGTPEDVAHHYRTMREELSRLCEVMGMRVVDAEVVDA